MVPTPLYTTAGKAPGRPPGGLGTIVPDTYQAYPGAFSYSKTEVEQDHMSIDVVPARDVARRRAPRPTPRREVGMEVGTPRALVHVGCKRVCPSRPQAGHYMYVTCTAATRARARATQPGPAESECTKVPCRAGSKGPEPVKQRAAPAGTFACAVRPSRLPRATAPRAESYDGRDVTVHHV